MCPNAELQESVSETQGCLFVSRFYGPVNPMGSCQVQPVCLTKLLLDRLSSLSG